MNKSERKAGIVAEARKASLSGFTSCNKDINDALNLHGYECYIAGTNSRANAEYLIRRAVEMTKERQRKGGPLSGNCIFEDKYESADQILAELLKEIE